MPEGIKGTATDKDYGAISAEMLFGGDGRRFKWR